ncbi:hypothetical protein TEPIDINF_001409 [Tepidibacillus infernus]|uniref:Lipoprotein n=1 Tax=Tepidibacillus decaturensis TaxID=1413211 RepID=A0A135L4Q0_9BACI|nr:hypothetical protein [Tepidibacillus decaturensis]KXG43936.1 hypothetical protein U473_07895 [Tepidibacillus decaturensis]
MKKTVLFLLISIFFFVGTLGCSPKSDVSYEILFNGFVTSKPTIEDILPYETIIFENEADWNAFSNKYLPVTRSVATMLKSIDFAKNDLIYTGSISAKADLYSVSSRILGYKIENNLLEPIWDTNFKDRIYAVNDISEYQFIQPFVILSLVKKSEIPNKLQNFYRPK